MENMTNMASIFFLVEVPPSYIHLHLTHNNLHSMCIQTNSYTYIYIYINIFITLDFFDADGFYYDKDGYDEKGGYLDEKGEYHEGNDVNEDPLVTEVINN